MEQPLWMLVPWGLFALALGIKAWRFGALFRRQLGPAPSRTELARQQLERLWRQDQPKP